LTPLIIECRDMTPTFRNVYILFFSFSLIASFAHHAVFNSASAQSLIRDTEVETIIRFYSTPLFRAAGLKESNVKIFIVKDNSLNAFIAGGQRLFINTGLILASETANQIIGVIAHETGHISGGHLSRMHSALSKNSTASALSLVLGGAAAIATGRSDVGAAIFSGGQNLALRNFLSYSRVQEAAADQAATQFLDQTKTSARGLLEFMEKLGDQELLSIGQQDPYVRTHPLTRERIDTIANFVENSPYSNKKDPPYIAGLHHLMKAKIFAFVHPAVRTFQRYKKNDNSLHGRYARAIGLYRQGKLDDALQLMDSLISEKPANPYFHELRGQMLFEGARLAESLASYRIAVKLMPGSALIRRDLARVQLELNEQPLIEAAVKNLEAALTVERDSAFNWRLLAIAHRKNNDQGRSSLALAEEALIENKPESANYHAGRALKLFPHGSREWLQGEDIRLAANELRSRAKQNLQQ